METSPSTNLLLQEGGTRPQPLHLSLHVLDLNQTILLTAVILLERSLLYEIT